MASSKILAVEVASESAYGSIDPVTGLPSSSGLSFMPMAFELAGWSDGWAGEYAEDADTAGHAGFFANPPEVSAPYDASGNKLDVRSGTLTVHCDVRGFGLGFPAPYTGLQSDEAPLAALLGSSMRTTNTGLTGRTKPVLSAASASDVTVADPGTGEEWEVGEVVLCMVDSCLEANRIISISTGGTDPVLTFVQPWSRQLTSSDDLIRGLNFIIDGGAQSGSRGASIALRLKTLRATATAYGCRLQSVIFVASETGKLTAQMEVLSPYILYEEHNTNQQIDESPRAISAPACTLRGTGLKVDAQKLAYEHEGWQLEIQFGTERIGGGCAFGTADLEPVAIDVTFTVQSKKIYDFDKRDRLDSVLRPVSACASPHLVVGTPPVDTTGWGFNIPAGYLAEPRDNEVGGEVLSQTRVYKPGPHQDASGNKNVVLFLGG